MPIAPSGAWRWKMDLFRRPVTLLCLALVIVLACGCGVQEADEEPEVIFAGAAPGPTVEVDLPGGR